MCMKYFFLLQNISVWMKYNIIVIISKIIVMFVLYYEMHSSGNNTENLKYYYFKYNTKTTVELTFSLIM